MFNFVKFESLFFVLTFSRAIIENFYFKIKKKKL